TPTARTELHTLSLHDALPIYARRDRVEHVLLAAHHHGVTGVVAPLVPDDDVDVRGEDVDHLPLPLVSPLGADHDDVRHQAAPDADRKSTRLNSSHDQISYAVF